MAPSRGGTMSLCNNARRVSRRLWRWAMRQQHRLQRAWLVRLSLPAIERVATVSWCVESLFSPRVRWNGILRYESGCEAVQLARAEALSTMMGGVLEKLIDRRMHLGRQLRSGEKWPDLQAAAGMLVDRIGQLRRDHPGRPIIVAPFHYVSQYANIYLVDELRIALGLESISVVSGVPRDLYGDDAVLIPGVRVLYTYDNDNRNALGLRVIRSLKRDGVAVLFADVPPFSLHRFPMETVGVQILGRPARIHNGAFRIGAPLGGVLLPFYLRFTRGRFGIQIFDSIPLAEEGAPQRVADCIGHALSDNYPRWIMAGHPSMYAFSPSK
jgi:hypothetical protein